MRMQQHVDLTSVAKPLYLSGSSSKDAPVELKDIEAIIDLMRKNDLSVFEMEKEGFKLKLQRGPDGQPLLTTPIALAPSLAGATSPGPETAATPQPRADTARLKEIVSPMVGTFYRAASPDAPPFVDVGKTVNEDSVVGILSQTGVINGCVGDVGGLNNPSCTANDVRLTSVNPATLVITGPVPSTEFR